MKLADVRVDDDRPRGREAWNFLYEGAQVRAAAARQAAYHRDREAVYIAEAARLEGEMRSGAVELREQHVTGGPQFAAVLDPQLSAQLGDARQRRDNHATKAKRFEAYASAIQHGGSYQLTIEDVDYFALHREPGD